MRARPTRPRTGDLSGFLDTTTGLAAVQEALQADRTLWTAAPEHKATIPLSTLTLPPLKHHPWSAMLARVAPSPAPAPEALASDVPAEFYYVRAAGLGSSSICSTSSIPGGPPRARSSRTSPRTATWRVATRRSSRSAGDH